VVDSLVVTDDFEIADLNFRVDNLTHTFAGDVTTLLRAPNGYGTDLIALIGAGINQGAGVNINNVVIDDQATGDMLIAPDTQAPYTGSWLPIYNDPSWAAVGFGGPEPVGALER
jgi:hypothetical protein